MSLPSHLHALPSITNIPVGSYSHLSLEELALLPLSALSAHRAVRTLADVIVSPRTSPGDDLNGGSTALVLQGHDGSGSMVVQMLHKRGVTVIAQVPESFAPGRKEVSHTSSTPLSANHTDGSTVSEATICARLRAWGAEEIYIGHPLKVINQLTAEGRSLDAVVDTVGGLDIWIASQRLLLAPPDYNRLRVFSRHSQFTTLVGDNPNKPVPTAQDNLRSGFRSFRRNVTVSVPAANETEETKAGLSLSKGSTASLPLVRRSSRKQSTTRTRTLAIKRTVGYAWVNAAADVDYEGEDVRDALGSVVGMVEEGWIRPWIGDQGDLDTRKVVPFDEAAEVFRRDDKGPVGLLQDGGTCVVKIVP